jgi:tRNA1(Val) A37 N6-methylase TrmN6
MSCVGIEARREAVELAKRSVTYNCGSDNSRVRVVNRDFRWIYHKKHYNSTRGDTQGSVDITEDTIFHDGDGHNDDDGQDDGDDNIKFDIITGTPPYFKVDFDVDKGTSVVHQAIIREGGMPTCKESAPARCEFRGGIEAYCKAASVSLSSGGVFTVCENWMNHGRVLAAATASRLTIFRMQRVVGREGKPPLFCVYSMTRRHRSSSSDDDDEEEEEEEDRRSTSVRTGDNNATASAPAEFEDDLIVRDRAGAWTAQYLLVLRDLSYPILEYWHPRCNVIPVDCTNLLTN